MSLALMLKLIANELNTANDGLGTLEVAEAVRPDLILLNIGESSRSRFAEATFSVGG